ncbi:MAG: alpha/beta hydrolase [Ilumatobacteraceae bacterium]
MPLDDDVRQLLDQLTDAPALSAGTVADARRNYDAAPRPEGDPIARVEDLTVPCAHGTVPVRLYASSDEAGLPVVVFFHGGGWVLSSVDGHDHVARRLARSTGALVISVDYRLAPEHPFPAAHDDCWAAVSWLAGHADEWGGDPTRIAVCGDSAGGNLAAGVALRARDEGLALALQALIYPCIVDDPSAYPSMRENATGLFLTADDMQWFWGHFVLPGDRRDGRAVPARAEHLTGVAPAFVQTAELVHGFVARWSLMHRAHEALDDLATALRAALT